jgi:three-Cys-motif partner protein
LSSGRGRGGGVRLPELKERYPQTKTKHLILERYAGAWGGIILNGLKARAARSGRSQRIRFTYVDAFAHTGRYARDTDTIILPGQTAPPVWGSPIIGINALKDHQKTAEEYGLHLEWTAILCEQDPRHFRRLLESLEMAGYGSQVRVNCPPTDLQHGQIAVFQEDFSKIAPAAAAHTDGPVYSLVLLDPYGPKGIPYSVVRTFVAGGGIHSHRDVIINWPYQDQEKKTGLIGRPDCETQPHLSYYDELYGDGGAWQELWQAERSASEEGGSVDSEAFLAGYYRDRLQEMDPTVIVKTIALRFPRLERTMYYLFLTTHNPDGALKMNEELWKAKVLEGELRSRHRGAEPYWKAGQLAFLDEVPAEPTRSARPDFDIDGLALELARLFAGKSVGVREILRSQVNSEHKYWKSHIVSALNRLKKQGKAEFRGLGATDVVRFAGGGGSEP